MYSIHGFLRTIFTNTAVLLAIGGAAGTNARYWLGWWLGEASWRAHTEWLSVFPLGTFTINVTGSFVLGLVGVVFLDKMPEYRAWFLLLGTGFCGGYTTFSTFEWETLKLLRTKATGSRRPTCWPAWPSGSSASGWVRRLASGFTAMYSGGIDDENRIRGPAPDDLHQQRRPTPRHAVVCRHRPSLPRARHRRRDGL